MSSNYEYTGWRYLWTKCTWSQYKRRDSKQRPHVHQLFGRLSFTSTYRPVHYQPFLCLFLKACFYWFYCKNITPICNWMFEIRPRAKLVCSLYMFDYFTCILINYIVGNKHTFLPIYDLDFVKVFCFKLILFHGGFRDLMVVHQHSWSNLLVV